MTRVRRSPKRFALPARLTSSCSIAIDGSRTADSSTTVAQIAQRRLPGGIFVVRSMRSSWVRLALGPGQSVPWHHHSNITDTFFCMEGPMQVLTRDPRATHVLDPGASCSVGPGTVHYVCGVDGRPCRFMIVQGIGVYDFVPALD